MAPPLSASAPAANQAEQLPGTPAVIATEAVQTYHLSLAEAKSRTLSNSIIMDLASTQVAAKSSCAPSGTEGLFAEAAELIFVLSLRQRLGHRGDDAGDFQSGDGDYGAGG